MLQFFRRLRDHLTEWAPLLELPGLGHVEVWLERIPDRSEVKELHATFHRFSLNLHAPFLHLSLSTNDTGLIRLSKDKISRAIEVAQKLQARVITCHAGPYPFYMPKEQALENLAKHVLGLQLGDQPVVTIENMPVRSGTLLEPFALPGDVDLLLSFLPNLRITLDVGHCIQNDVGFASFFEAYHPIIENIHLHDARTGGKGHLPLGLGDLDIGELLNLLRVKDYENEVALETLTVSDTEHSWNAWASSEQRLPRSGPSNAKFRRATG